MRGCAAFILLVLQWDTIKYRCGEGRPAAMFLSNKVHPVSYLSGPADFSRAPTHTPAETDRAEKNDNNHTACQQPGWQTAYKQLSWTVRVPPPKLLVALVRTGY